MHRWVHGRRQLRLQVGGLSIEGRQGLLLEEGLSKYGLRSFFAGLRRLNRAVFRA